MHVLQSGNSTTLLIKANVSSNRTCVQGKFVVKALKPSIDSIDIVMATSTNATRINCLHPSLVHQPILIHASLVNCPNQNQEGKELADQLIYHS